MNGDDVKIDWNAVAKVGIPGVIAMFLVYRLSVGFDVFAKDHERLLESMAQVVTITRQSDIAQRQILYVLQTMCVNQARTDSQRADCLRKIETRH